MRDFFFAAAIAAVTIGQASTATANTVDILFTESASGVSIVGAGSIDTASLTLEFSDQDISSLRFVTPIDGGFGLGGGVLADFYSFASTESFGPSGSTFISTGVGDYFGIAFGGSTGVALGLPDGYASGAALSFSNFVSGASFSSLGITAAPVTIATAGPNDINLSFTTAAVPLPAAGWMLVAGIGALGAASRRRKSRT